MGRRRDNPADQKAKGYPGKRKSKVDRAIAEAERLAGLLAASPAQSSDPLAPPAYLKDPRLKPALTVWQDTIAEADRNNLVDKIDRLTFAMWCVYMGEFVIANEEILKKGYSVNVRTVSGSMMPRTNPAVDRRDRAFDCAFKLAREFGLTKLSRLTLFKDQAALPLGSLFPGHDGSAPPKPEAQPQGQPQPEENPLGMLARFDSEPPTRPN